MYSRVNLAKHEVKGVRGSVAPVPGYGRIDMTNGSIYWMVDVGGNAVDIVSSRAIADELRAKVKWLKSAADCDRLGRAENQFGDRLTSHVLANVHREGAQIGKGRARVIGLQRDALLLACSRTGCEAPRETEACCRRGKPCECRRRLPHRRSYEARAVVGAFQNSRELENRFTSTHQAIAENLSYPRQIWPLCRYPCLMIAAKTESAW